MSSERRIRSSRANGALPLGHAEARKNPIPPRRPQARYLRQKQHSGRGISLFCTNLSDQYYGYRQPANSIQRALAGRNGHLQVVLSSRFTHGAHLHFHRLPPFTTTAMGFKKHAFCKNEQTNLIPNPDTPPQDLLIHNE